MRALKFAGAAVAAVIVVLALLLIIGVPSGFLTSTIQDRVERETGYRLTIAGSTKIGLWPSLNVTLNDITLQDPKDRDASKPRDHRQRAGRRDAGERVVGPPASHRTRHHHARAVRAAAARAHARRQSVAAGGIRHRAAARPSRSSASSHRRHDRVLPICATASSAASRTINADATIGADRKIKRHRQRAQPASIRSNSTINATLPAPPLERQNIPVELDARCARPACRRRCRPRPRCGSTARS